MRVLLFLAAISTLICCSNSNRSLISNEKEAEFKTFFVETYKEIDSTIAIDSFRFVRFDTLTLMHKYNTMLDYIVNDMKESNYDLENSLAIYKEKLRLASLAYGLSGSLYRSYKMEADDAKKDFDKFADKSTELAKIADSITKLRDKADSTNALNYYAVCFYQVRTKKTIS